MDLQKHITTFTELGLILKDIDKEAPTHRVSEKTANIFFSIKGLMKNLHHENGWFTERNIIEAILSISEMLKPEKLEEWLQNYNHKINANNPVKKIGVIMAGNLPLVGFHDFLCVLCSDNKFIGKLSSNDNKLLPKIAEIIISLEADYEKRICFTNDMLKDVDAYIATGSNNTARYFNYYLGKHPNIIRKNRNSIAILDGNESHVDLEKLGSDMFRYFGLGCRNVTKIMLPKDYQFDTFFKAIESYKDLIKHNKYANNYEYYKSIYLVNKEPHLDNGFVLLKQSHQLSSPVATVFFDYYSDIDEAKRYIAQNKENLQCIASNNKSIDSPISLGNTQNPQLWDYADNIDTMDFLLELKK